MKWWTRSWNPVTGCSHVSPGCDHCWAERMAARFRCFDDVVAPGGKWTGRAACHPERLSGPLHWRKPQSVFVVGMGDLFHPSVPNEFIAAVFGVMAACPQHRFYVLTKRPERMESWFQWVAEQMPSAHLLGAARGVRWFAWNYTRGPYDPLDRIMRSDRSAWAWPPPNVWIGATVEGPGYLPRLDALRRIPAAHRFASLEPLLADLGRVDLTDIAWVVVGGESGPGARPCDVAWIRDVVRQCREAAVPCFVKQLGAAYVDELNGVAGAGLRGHIDEDAVALVSRYLTDRAGADPAEWPEDLRVQVIP
jgi:protein gp37